MKKLKHFLAAALLLGLTPAANAQTTVVDSFRHNNVWRSFRVYVPAALPTSAPLILNLHGLGSNSLEQQQYSNFMPIADTAKFLMVYPQGLYNAQFGITYWNAGFPLTASTGTDDVGFLSALIDTMQRRYQTNPIRTYVTGMSMGGYMSDYLGCYLSGKIAAIASVTGSIVPGVQNSCSPSGLMPALHIHGTADATVPYGGNSNGLPIDSVVAHWRRVNQCTATPTVTALPNVNTTDSSTVTRSVWTNAAGTSSVEFYKVANGGHTWPGAPYNVPGLVTNQDFNASAEIWRFFRPYNRTSGLGTSTISPKGNSSVFPNPCVNVLALPEADAQSRVRIYTLTGSLVLDGSGNRIDVSGLPSGMYQVQYNHGEQQHHSRFAKQ
ncbi:MAG: T9SS type A sorting domain-containing protein [Sphingobacteriales bacterium]|nr:MAG: T9SS type A sorting domain-containing protein [Sphingobacteriales bacterium]